MKKFFFLAAAMVSSMFAQAQQTVNFGFEDADKGKNYHCQYALTPRPDGLGDWVNVHEDDEWDEQNAEAAHSGDYGLYVLNDEAGSSNSWDRGFKLANLDIKENVPYRVSFWVKGPMDGKLSSWLSVGMENFDKSFTTADGKNYGLDQITLNGDGEWQRVSYVSVYHGKEAIKTVIDGQSWVGNADFPFDEDSVSYKEHFGGYIPETFFFIANMNSAGEYMLDDICIEENVAVKGVYFNGGIVKIDFGFPTNIADLAKATPTGTLELPTSCVSIKQGETEYEVQFLEGKNDGFLYAFLPEGMVLNEDSEEPVIVSFTPAEDCPIVYNTTQRPGASDVELSVLPFSAEVAYFDETVDAVSSAWVGPELLSATPENDSFNLKAEDFKEVRLNYNMVVDITYASASISQMSNFGLKEIDLSKNMTLSDDQTTVIIAIPELEDGDWTLSVFDVTNEMGVPQDNDVKLTYAVGFAEDGGTEIETIYKSDFTTDETDAVPKGWNTYNEAGYHLYGFNEDGSRMKYGYGANPGGGGTRLFDGFSGDFTKALYWGTRGTNEGYASFGELIQDYMNPDGTIDEESLPDGVSVEDISLYLTPRKYNIKFKMAAWKGEPQFNFTLEDLDGNVVSEFTNYTAKPNLNGGKGKVTGTLELQADFMIADEGYYVIKFVSAEAQWQEFMLADVELITMPSKAAYYGALLQEALDKANDVYFEGLNSDSYEGATLDALKASIDNAEEMQNDVHCPSEVNALIADLDAKAAALTTRMGYIDQYEGAIEDAKFGIESLQEAENPKYMNVDVVAEVADIIAKYGDKEAKDLSDEELAQVVPVLTGAVAKLGNIQKCTDILTIGIGKAIATYDKLLTEDESVLEAAQNAISDDRTIAANINAANKMQLYKLIVDKTWNESETNTVDSVEVTTYTYMTSVPAWDMENVTDSILVAKVQKENVVGIELTGYVANPNMYRVAGVDGMPGWTVSTLNDKNLNIGYGGTAPSDAEYVTDQFINIYGDANYKVEQSIEGLPVGVYTVVMATRTPWVDHMSDHGRNFYYNAQNDSTQVWDKYIYATVGENTVVAPYLGLGSYYGSHSGEYNTVLRNLVVTEDGVLTIGATESYVSGKAIKHETNVATGAWEGTCMVDDVHIYFTAPLEGYDYAAAYKEMATIIDTVQPNATITEVYNLNGVRMNNMQKGVNIVKMSNGKIVKILVK